MSRNIAAVLQLAMLLLVSFQSPLLGFCLCSQQPFIGTCSAPCQSPPHEATCEPPHTTPCGGQAAAGDPCSKAAPCPPDPLLAGHHQHGCDVFFALDADPFAPAPERSSSTPHPTLFSPPTHPPGHLLPSPRPGHAPSWSGLGLGQPPPPRPSLLDLYAVLRL